MNKRRKFKITRWLLLRLADQSMVASIMEDLEYRFVLYKEEKGLAAAFVLHVFQSVVIILPLLAAYVFGGLTMLRNYLKIALRHIRRFKGYSFINIAGLAIGMTCAMLIYLWVQSELGFDRHHEHADRIYRVNKKYQMGEETGYNPSTPFPLAYAAKQQIAGIREGTKFTRSTMLVKSGDKIFSENSVCCADTSFFKVFTYEFLKGRAEMALAAPNSIVLTRDMAAKYFGAQEPIGKILTIDNREEFIVEGVVENAPVQSEMQYDFFIPISFIARAAAADDWGSHWLRTFVLMEQNADPDEVEQKLSAMIKERLPEEKISLLLQPLTNIHLYAIDGKPEGMKHVYFFSIIAVFILFIACINFVNLTMAYSLRRAREVGLRKTVGAGKIQIAVQFFGESILFTFIALVIAFMLLHIVSPAFSDLAGRKLTLEYNNLKHILGFIMIAVVTGLLSGIYPALFLSSFRPAGVLKGGIHQGLKGSALRRVLVIVQFSLSIGLMIGTSVIYSQLNYIKTRDKGYTEENILYLYMNRELRENYQPVKNELLKNPGILSVSRTSELPNSIWSIMRGIVWEGKESDEGAAFGFAAVDHDYFETMQMEIVQGRGFSRASPADSSNYIFNQKAIEVMGFEEPIGRRFTLDEDEPGVIVGVVKDFHSLPLNYEIEPVVMILAPDAWYRRVLIRVQTDNPAEVLRYIENVWNRFVPAFPFEYGFLDERFDRMYDAEVRAGKLFGYFVILAILISCMGLFGLASFTAEQKTKEIGVRKVLGASVPDIFYLLSREFTKWVLLANVIAWPVAYFAMTKWLQNFAYRVRPALWVFGASALAALLIALVTVSWQVIRAARGNPVDSLRYE